MIGMKLIVAVALLAIVPSWGALAQSARQPQSSAPAASPVQEAITASYNIGLATGTAVAREMAAAEEKLKWVLDNWVPKAPAK